MCAFLLDFPSAVEKTHIFKFFLTILNKAVDPGLLVETRSHPCLIQERHLSKLRQMKRWHKIIHICSFSFTFFLFFLLCYAFRAFKFGVARSVYDFTSPQLIIIIILLMLLKRILKLFV
jgi:hypothetical protein